MSTGTIAVVGLWHLGCVTAACLARSGNRIIGIDLDSRRIENLKKGIAPLFEPDLERLLSEGIEAGRLRFTEDLREAESADYIWITTDTPLDDTDCCDLTELYSYFKIFGQQEGAHQYIVSSQVPIGTCGQLIKEIPKEKNAQIAYIPENLQLGKAVKYFSDPDMFVIGSESKTYATRLKDELLPFSSDAKICDLKTAEMVKHAINSFLATTISYANEMADLAVKMGANAYDVVDILKLEPRLGKRLPLLPGPWFSGGTLARDVRILQEIGRKTKTSTALMDAVMDINENRIHRLLDRLEEHVALDQAQVTVYGLVYTEGTDTLRRSPGLQVIEELKQRKAQVCVYEPMIESALLADSAVKIHSSDIDAAAGADAAIVVRAGAVKDLGVEHLSEAMNGNAVLDIWSAFSQEEMKNYHMVHIVPGMSE